MYLHPSITSHHPHLLLLHPSAMGEFSSRASTKTPRFDGQNPGKIQLLFCWKNYAPAKLNIEPENDGFQIGINLF